MQILNEGDWPEHPEFYAHYAIKNIINNNICNDNFISRAIELNNIKLATEKDHNYEIDKWASLFKATTWEDIRMIVNDNPTLHIRLLSKLSKPSVRFSLQPFYYILIIFF